MILVLCVCVCLRPLLQVGFLAGPGVCFQTFLVASFSWFFDYEGWNWWAHTHTHGRPAAPSSVQPPWQTLTRGLPPRPTATAASPAATARYIALLFGSMLSATDPVAVVALVKELGMNGPRP